MNYNELVTKKLSIEEAKKGAKKELRKDRVLFVITIIEIVFFVFAAVELILAEKNVFWNKNTSSIYSFIILRIVGVVSYLLIAGLFFAAIIGFIFLLEMIIGNTIKADYYFLEVIKGKKPEEFKEKLKNQKNFYSKLIVLYNKFYN